LAFTDTLPGSIPAYRRDSLGRFAAGGPVDPSGRTYRLREKIAQLRATFGPNAMFSPLNESRLVLAAKHFEIARKSRDPNTSVRSIHAAERLVSLVAADQAAPAPKPETLDDILGSR
jgi:hypothetical protein